MTSTNPRLVIPSLEEVLKKDSQREIKKFTVVGHTDPFLPPAPGDFQLQEETQNEFIGEEGVTKLIHDPYVAPYCNDFPQRRILFAKTDPAKDIYTAPFIYLAQLAHATHVFSVPFELVEKVLIGKDNPKGEFVYNKQNTSWTSEDEVVFVFSTGRCGSTLLTKVLNRIEGVLGMQEPEPFTDLTGVRNFGGASDDEIVTLLRLSMLAHCKPTIPKHGNIQKWVVKFQSQVTEIFDLFLRAFPKGHHLFMYRNADAVTKSIGRMVSGFEEPLEDQEAHENLFSGLKWLPDGVKKGKDFAAIYWLTTMRKTLDYINAGQKIPCIRYEELVADPEKMVRELAKYFNITLKEDNIPHVLDAMKGHSQEGVFAIHEHTRLNEAVDQMRELVAKDKEIGNGNFILPGTLLV